VSEPNILRPSRTYDIKLKIKGENYSNDVSSVRISSSLATGYQIMTITINITPQTILLNKLYGEDAIILNINKLDATEGVITENMEFDLMLLNSSFDIPLSDILITDTQKDRSDFDLITVPRLPFETMTTMVNPVFGMTKNKGPWTGAKTPKEIIQTIIKELVKTNPKLEYDSDGENTDKILQMCIPPTTLYKAIKEIDKNFGLYDGVLVVFCQYDNTLQIMNLSTTIKKNFNLFVEHLNQQSKEIDIEQSSKNKKYFYTYDNLSTTYIGNSKFGVLGKTIKHIVLPSDKLSYTIEQDLDDICNSNGLVGQTKGKVTHINTSAAKRTKYYIENNGFGLSETFIKSSISKQISDISRLNFQIERNLAIENLLKIGCCVKLKTNTIEHQDISGKYILFSSDINWVKQAEWQTTATLELIRTNKTI
jgi:hypothetical protein